MPWIIDYPLVLEQMREQRFKCLYYNSGAFAFPPDIPTQTRGWIGPSDDTIRAESRALVRQIAEPYETTLAALATRLWREHLPGRAWLMPMSHWNYELDHGSRGWMPALLERIDVDPGLLTNRNNAAAIEFSLEESPKFEYFTRRLLEMLISSDFMIAFPKRDTLCTLHHHKQLWWTTRDAAVIAALDGTVS